MNKELIIDSAATVIQIALLEENKLVELHHQKTNTHFTVGDIFLGKVKHTMPGLNAAFVDTGYSKDAFLHYTDLGPRIRSLLSYTKQSINASQTSHQLNDFRIEPEIDKGGKIEHVFKKKDAVLVQILKEPISTKGPRLSCEITIPGRFVVIAPFQDNVSVSKKIGNKDERTRLQTIVESIKPKNFGVIVRTAAEGKTTSDIHEEIMGLMAKWKQVHKQLHNAKPPMKLLSELDKTSSILRDLLTDSFNRIIVNDEEMYLHLQSFMKSLDSKKVSIVHHYKGKKAIFEEYGVTKQIKASFGKTVSMKSGAYLVIEHTEAMHVIDVNSGHKIPVNNKEVGESALKVNLEAAAEIARQVRLRDIGGLIIVDFIDMKNPEYKKDLVSKMRQYMKSDRAQHTILPLSKFGLMQITRQRSGPALKIDTSEHCPTCNGTGKIHSTVNIADEIERDLEFIMRSHPKTKVKLVCHPFIESYFTKGFPSKRLKWRFKYGRNVKIEGSFANAILNYNFYSLDTQDEIRLS